MRSRFVTALLVLAACGDDRSTATDASVEPDAPVAPPDFTHDELIELGKLTPLPAVPADPTNAYAGNAKAVLLGQMLFFDKSFSGSLTVGDDGMNGGVGTAGDVGKVSCASCHAAGSGTLDDQRSKPGNISLGTGYGGRNALGIVNASFYKWTNWGGRFDSQWSLPLAVAEGGATMKGNRLQIIHALYAKYRIEYNAIFPTPLDPALDPAAADASRFPPSGKPKAIPTDPDGPWELMAAADRDIANRIYANFGKALAAYMRTLVSGNAPFDRYMLGERTAISDSAKRGAKLFLKHCVACHSGTHFADDQFHALAVPQSGLRVPATDLGRFQDVNALIASPFNTSSAYSDKTDTGMLTGLVQADAMKGQFRTKSLRNVATSAPYMHAGQHATLEEVVTFYNVGGGDPGATGIVKDSRIVPLGLTAAQQTELVDFMKTLTGDPPPVSRLVDTSK